MSVCVVAGELALYRCLAMWTFSLVDVCHDCKRQLNPFLHFYFFSRFCFCICICFRFCSSFGFCFCFGFTSSEFNGHCPSIAVQPTPIPTPNQLNPSQLHRDRFPLPSRPPTNNQQHQNQHQNQCANDEPTLPQVRSQRIPATVPSGEHARCLRRYVHVHFFGNKILRHHRLDRFLRVFFFRFFEDRRVDGDQG